MKYIYKNNCNIDFSDLKKSTINNNSIDGLFVNVRDLQVNYNGELIDLDSYLEKINDINKKIILNIIPIRNKSTDIVSIQIENRNYVNNISKITKKYSSINFFYTSTSTRILYFLEEIFKENCCGYYISEDLNYVDTCFYIFPLNRYNKEIISQEIERGKDVYFIVNNKKELETLTILIENDFKDNYNNMPIILCPDAL